MPEVTFVYLGERIPKYARDSLLLAKKFSGLDVRLLCSNKVASKVKNLNISTIEIESFYDAKNFGQITSKILMPHGYRGGFWLKTLERFFVLEQYMYKFKIDKIFHAELDQLLFNCNELIFNIEKSEKKGVFVPFRDTNLAIASIFYCNKHESLKSLIDFTFRQKIIHNEMDSIAKWGKSNTNEVYILPTLATQILGTSLYSDFGFQVLDLTEIGGLVDAAQIGQWIGGEDPRNTPLVNKPRLKYVEKNSPQLLNSEQLSSIEFSFRDGQYLNWKIDANTKGNLYNIHLHSKIHSWILKNSQRLQNLLMKVNDKDLNEYLIISRYGQIRHHLKVSLEVLVHHPFRTLTVLIMRIRNYSNLKFGRRPSSYPYISGDTFRRFARYFYEKSGTNLEISSVLTNDIIFCETSELEKFSKEVIPKLNQPIKLLLGNSDDDFTEEKYSLLNSSNISKVYSQNLRINKSFVEVLPIGLENSWHSNNGVVTFFKLMRLFRQKKNYRIAWTFNLSTNPQVRSVAAEHLLQSEFADYLGNLSPFEHRMALSKYAFVAAPPGNGLDTHRMWEALYLDCVPIVLRSVMAEKFYNHAIPIWIVDSYQELINVTSKDLEKKYEELKSRFTSKSLWFPYWRDLILENT